MYEEENIEPNFKKRDKVNPFQTPEFYFDSLEDRIIGGIEHTAKTKTTSAKIFQLLKPALGLVASFSIVYLLVYYPINTFLLKPTAKITPTESIVSDSFEAYSLNFSLIDENSLLNTILGDEPNTASEINPDEVLAYLSTGMNDLEIYSAIQN